MASLESRSIRCSICKTLLCVNITYSIYPCKSMETADCPVCGEELLRKNITGVWKPT